MSSESKNKKIALITTWYPPINGIAVNRMNAFANYLSERFEVEVFCLGKQNETIVVNSNLQVHYATSNKLFEKLKSNTLNDYKHQQYLFDKLVEELSLNRKINRVLSW